MLNVKTFKRSTKIRIELLGWRSIKTLLYYSFLLSFDVRPGLTLMLYLLYFLGLILLIYYDYYFKFCIVQNRPRYPANMDPPTPPQFLLWCLAVSLADM